MVSVLHNLIKRKRGDRSLPESQTITVDKKITAKIALRGLKELTTAVHNIHLFSIVAPAIQSLYRDRQRKRGCLLSYSQTEPVRALSQPRKHLLAEPCSISATLIVEVDAYIICFF